MHVDGNAYRIIQDVPRKGNVDRNIRPATTRSRKAATFPARGTWIEISAFQVHQVSSWDVPRKGNVDRNSPSSSTSWHQPATFPARGTWIEMLRVMYSLRRDSATFPARGTWIEIFADPAIKRRQAADVPRKGNVDRNVS